MIEYKFIIVEAPGILSENVRYFGGSPVNDIKASLASFEAIINFENCGEIINNNPHLDLDKLKEYSEKLYKNSKKISDPDLCFEICEFFIQFDNTSEIYYPLELHEIRCNDNDNKLVMTYNEYMIKKLLE